MLDNDGYDHGGLSLSAPKSGTSSMMSVLLSLVQNKTMEYARNLDMEKIWTEIHARIFTGGIKMKRLRKE